MKVVGASLWLPFHPTFPQMILQSFTLPKSWFLLNDGISPNTCWEKNVMTWEGSGDQGRPPWSRGFAVGKHKAHRINFTTDLEIQCGDTEEGFLLCMHCLNIQSTFSDHVLGPGPMIFQCVLDRMVASDMPPVRRYVNMPSLPSGVMTATKLQLSD